jgi:hypothetical protein
MHGPTITHLTRRDIFDQIVAVENAWFGRMPPSEFLARLYPIDAMPSHDARYRTAREDIVQHTENWKDDWDLAWPLEDPRFDLLCCGDEQLLAFLCQTLHPELRRPPEEVGHLFGAYNRLLLADGWEIYPASAISGRPIFSARPLLARPPNPAPLLAAAQPVDLGEIGRISTRLLGACESDPDHAVGQAKNLVESVCKTILEARTGTPAPSDLDLEQLVKRVRDRLAILPESVDASEKGAEHLRALLGQLGAVVHRLGALRNLYGDGHGKPASSRGLDSRHARLAAYAAVGLATFLFETHLAQQRS